MLVPLSWLRDFAPFDLDPRALGEVFDDLGMVVEGIQHVGESLEGVVVAKVLEVHRIEGADKIRRVLVDAGEPDPVEVVCGAWNFEAGATVPLATVGAVLPGEFRITQRKMKGVTSNGMICSAAELDLGGDHEGILVLPEGLEPGTSFAEAMGIERDVVFDLAIEGNRPDALSIAGVARDAAARLAIPFAIPEVSVREEGAPAGDAITVEVEATDLCPRFTARLVRGVEVRPSPAWVVRRLTLAGMRAINNVVDASNYVMLELGQPTHPYDGDLLPGPGFEVRRARPGETIVTLDDVERRLGDGDDCLICDATGTPVGIAGIMGGASSEISDTTSTVVLEAAHFDPMAIARTSKRLKLRTEASARFEKGTDPAGIPRASARVCELIGTGTVAPGLVDVDHVAPREHITVRVGRVNQLLGTEVAAEQVQRYLEPLGFDVAAGGEAGSLSVLPPTFRPDVAEEINVVEEVARHHGYSNIVRTVPRSPHVGHLSAHQQGRRRVRQILAGAGVSEAQTPSLLGPGDHERAGLPADALIHAADPMIVEESILRESLLPGLLRTLGFNAARRHPDVAFFEIGKVFRRRPQPPAGAAGAGTDLDATLPEETERLAVALAGGDGAPDAKRLWDVLAVGLRLQPVELEPVERAGLHPTRTAELRAGAEALGVVGEVDPAVAGAWGAEGRVGWLDVDLVRLLSAPTRSQEERPVSRFPSSDIDLAFVVDDRTQAAAVERTLAEAAGDLLVELQLFDVYRGERLGEGRRSLAWRLRFNAADRTLTDAEVGEVRRRCIDAVERAHPAELRG